MSDSGFKDGRGRHIFRASIDKALVPTASICHCPQHSVGILVLALGVAMGTDLAWCRIGTSEPVFGEDQSCSLGWIAGRVPMS